MYRNRSRSDRNGVKGRREGGGEWDEVEDARKEWKERKKEKEDQN